MVIVLHVEEADFVKEENVFLVQREFTLRSLVVE